MADDEPEAAPEDAGAAGEAPTYRRPATAPKIKRMMQRDEDVGKIAQYTPLALGRALELFVASLAQSAAAVAKSRKSKLLTAAHLKAAVNADPTLDFLKDAVAKAPELPAAAEGGDSDGADAKPKRVRKPRAKKDKAAGEGDGSDSDGEVKTKKPRKRAPAKPKAAAPEAAPQQQPPPAPAAVEAAEEEEEEEAFQAPAAYAYAAAAPPAAGAEEDDYDA